MQKILEKLKNLSFNFFEHKPIEDKNTSYVIRKIPLKHTLISDIFYSKNTDYFYLITIPGHK